MDVRLAGELARASHDRFKQGWIGIRSHTYRRPFFFSPDVMRLTNTIVFLLGGNNLGHGIGFIWMAMISVVVVLRFCFFLFTKFAIISFCMSKKQ
jgi:hypothetical protein